MMPDTVTLCAQKWWCCHDLEIYKSLCPLPFHFCCCGSPGHFIPSVAHATYFREIHNIFFAASYIEMVGHWLGWNLLMLSHLLYGNSCFLCWSGMRSKYYTWILLTVISSSMLQVSYQFYEWIQSMPRIPWTLNGLFGWSGAEDIYCGFFCVI